MDSNIQENVVLYDWLSFTSKNHTPEQLIAALGLSHCPWTDTKGARGYQDRLYFGAISIHYNGREDMGVWCEMSGQGCRNVAPSITSEYGFWNWWQKQWLEFRQWLADNLGGGGGGSIIFPSPSECEHTYTEKILTSPTCIQKGTALYVCTKCGDSYTDTIDASGHDWLMEDSIPDELDEAGEVVTAGYDLYRCSICGEEYKDYARTGPPGSESGSTLSELIQQLFGSLGNLVGSLVDWILDLGTEAMEGFGSLGKFFEEKAEEVQGFGGEYVGFLGVFFEALPADIKTCISLALVLFGLTLFVRKVIL